MVKVEAKSFLGDVDITSANGGSQRATVKLTLQLNLAKSAKINAHEIVTVDKAPVPWKLISARTMSPVAAPMLSTGDISRQLDVVIIRSINPTECQLNGVTAANSIVPVL